MPKEQVRIPENIQAAVNALLHTCGSSLGQLTQAAPSIKEWFTVADAEEYSGMGRWSFIRAHKTGELPVAKMNKAKSGKILIRKTDLDKYIARHIRKNYVRTVTAPAGKAAVAP